MVILGQRGIERLKLCHRAQLAFDERLRGGRVERDDARVRLGRQLAGGQGKEIVAEHQRDTAVPARMDGRAPAPPAGVIDEVVVDQRGGVKQLDGGGGVDGPAQIVVAQPCGQEHQRRAQALAAGSDSVDTGGH